MLCKCKRLDDSSAVEVGYSLCEDIAENWRQGSALGKLHCGLLRTGSPASKTSGDLSFLECCCGLSWELQADGMLCEEFH